MMATKAPNTIPVIAIFERLSLSASKGEVEDAVPGGDAKVAESWIRSAAYTETFAGIV